MPTTDPQAELLTEVDAHNQVIGPIARGLAHTSGKYYRTIFILVKNEAGQILFQQRSATTALYPNCSDLSVGGHVNYGESYLAAATRELFEELGITTDPADLHFLQEVLVTLPSSHEYFYVYEYHLKPTDELKLDPYEVADSRWLTVAKAKESMLNSPADWYPRPVQVFNTLYP